MFHSPLLNSFDLHLYHAINSLAGYNRILDNTMIFFAKDALEIYAVLFVAAWFALPKKDIQNRHALVMAGFSGILALLLNIVISHIWFRPRPFTVLHKGTFTQLIPHASDASFPSDHASGSVGFAAGSWGKQRKWISYSFTVIAVIVMFARVYVGVHYPTDVLAGMVVGILASQIVWRFSKYLYPLTSFVANLFRFGPAAKTAKHARSSKRQSM